jgi:hypothetical protein
MITTRQATKKLGISAKTQRHYVAAKKVFSPEIVDVGGMVVHSWSEADIERLSRLLTKIADGRKRRSPVTNLSPSVPRKPGQEERSPSSSNSDEHYAYPGVNGWR